MRYCQRGYALLDVMMALAVSAIFAGGYATFFKMNNTAQTMATETLLASRSASTLISLMNAHPEALPSLKSLLPERYSMELNGFHADLNRLEITIQRGRSGVNDWTPVSIGTLLPNKKSSDGEADDAL